MRIRESFWPWIRDPGSRMEKTSATLLDNLVILYESINQPLDNFLQRAWGRDRERGPGITSKESGQVYADPETNSDPNF